MARSMVFEPLAPWWQAFGVTYHFRTSASPRSPCVAQTRDSRDSVKRFRLAVHEAATARTVGMT